ncbi:MAG: 3-deoxy-manno-octulosonate cytidylyltransferase [Actinobacteria bacterium]|nr:3-deoxy-manno-octulosonate cytidylyltransferase [Actinomycetota bacterium]
MYIIGIIPARMASSRFPGKPMANVGGIPMVGHVYLRSKMNKTLDDVYVATCDHQIKDYIELIGGKAIMTASTHERASDRTAEAMLKVEKKTGKKIDIVVMIQGDEPMIYPQMIDQALTPMLKHEDILVTNLMAAMKTKEEYEDINEVKVVVDKNSFALYFSREPIPSGKKGAVNIMMLKQVCIIPFKRDFLIKFNSWKQTPLEIIESVDMLRVLENGNKVKMVFTEYDTYSVDTKEDLEKVAKKMNDDELFKEYRKEIKGVKKT